MGTTHSWFFRIQRMLTESFYCIHIAHFFQVSIIPFFNLLNLMGCTETIKEVDEWHFTFNSCKMRYRAQVHNFLWVGLSQHSETGLTTCINVTVVTEDIQRLCSNGTCRNIKYTRKLFCSNFIHVRNHQKKTLRSCKCSGDRTCCQGTMYSTGCTCFRLHFTDNYLITKNVFLTCCCPLVNGVSHRTGWCNRIDCGNICIGISNMCSSRISIHRLFCSWH